MNCSAPTSNSRRSTPSSLPRSPIPKCWRDAFRVCIVAAGCGAPDVAASAAMRLAETKPASARLPPGHEVFSRILTDAGLLDRTPTHDPPTPPSPTTPCRVGGGVTFEAPDRRHRRHRWRRGLGHSTGNPHPQGSETPQREPTDPDTSPRPQPRPKQLTFEAQRRLQAARFWIAANRPYYSKAIFSCPIIPTAAPARVGIDETWRIYASSEHLESLTVKQTAAELIHVLNHALRDHAQRARNTGVDATNVPVWNVATDCEINDDLLLDDLLDDNWMLPVDIELEDYFTAEHYFRQLLEGAVAVEVHTECGSGCHSHHVDHELDADAETLSDFDRALLKRVVATAVTTHHKAHGAGSVPAGLARWAEQTLRPKVNWRQQFAAALRTSVHHKTGTADYSWQRPSRRQQPHDPVLRPAMTRPVPSIAVIVDTSGSMSEHALDRALTEIKAIIATVVPGDSVRVLSVDTDVHTDRHIHNINQIQLDGGGGTDMATGIAAAAEANPDAIVVITDAWTPWPPTRPPGARCVIAALTDAY